MKTSCVKLADVTFEIKFHFEDNYRRFFCYKTNEVLSNYNLGNIRLIYLLAGFYSYSYCFLIPDIMVYLLHNNGTDYFFFDSSFNLNLHLYAFCISIPLIGNI